MKKAMKRILRVGSQQSDPRHDRTLSSNIERSKHMLTKLYDACPTCGEGNVRSEGRSNRHSNGEWNEWREFKCGHRCEFSPNYMRVIVVRQCDEIVVAMRRRNAACKDACHIAIKQIIITHVEEHGVDPEWAKRLLRAVDEVIIDP